MKLELNIDNFPARLEERVAFELSLAALLRDLNITEVIFNCMVEDDYPHRRSKFSYTICTLYKYQSFNFIGVSRPLNTLGNRNCGLVGHLVFDPTYSRAALRQLYLDKYRCGRKQYYGIDTAIHDLHKFCRGGVI